eukprot:12600128-Alexandrium_andersonii.AAC.1
MSENALSPVARLLGAMERTASKFPAQTRVAEGCPLRPDGADQEEPGWRRATEGRQGHRSHSAPLQR